MELADNLKLKTQSLKPQLKTQNLSDREAASLLYHNIFDYPLTLADLIRWRTGEGITGIKGTTGIKFKKGFYFLQGREGLVYKRLLRQRISKRKLEIAEKVVPVLSLIPIIKMVAITGALAMGNASEESDIDLLIVTKKGTLWTTRLISYFVTWLLGIKIRKPNDKSQKDKLCLNMWLDESNLNWLKRDRNIYTSHEICQIIPLINKEKTYEKFLYKNKWTRDWWPNAVKILSGKDIKILRAKSYLVSQYLNIVISLFERLAFLIQYQYMRSKVTREVITRTRAIFHPNDWGKVILQRFV